MVKIELIILSTYYAIIGSFLYFYYNFISTDQCSHSKWDHAKSGKPKKISFQTLIIPFLLILVWFHQISFDMQNTGRGSADMTNIIKTVLNIEFHSQFFRPFSPHITKLDYWNYFRFYAFFRFRYTILIIAWALLWCQSQKFVYTKKCIKPIDGLWLLALFLPPWQNEWNRKVAIYI